MPKYDEFDLDLQTSKIDGVATLSFTSFGSCTCTTAMETYNCDNTTYGCGSGSNGGVCALE